MTRLTHDQAKRLAHAAADKCLKPKERAALEAHLADCPACRTDVAQLNWLHAAIARALRSRWATPHRSPIEMAARVRNRMQLNTRRKIVAGLAHAMVRFGSLAVVMTLAFGFVTQWRATDSDSTASSALAASDRNNALSFEFESDTDTSFYAVSSIGDNEPWQIPTSLPNGSRDTQY